MCNQKFSRYVLPKNIYGHIKFFSVPLNISPVPRLARVSLIYHFYHKPMIIMDYKECSINYIGNILILNDIINYYYSNLTDDYIYCARNLIIGICPIHEWFERYTVHFRSKRIGSMWRWCWTDCSCGYLRWL